MSSTAYGIAGATCWINVGTPNDVLLAGVDYNGSSTAGSNAGGSACLTGQNVYGVYDSVSGTYATQSTTASQPIFLAPGAWGHGDGSQAAIKFPNYVTQSSAAATPGNLAEQMAIGNAGSTSNYFLNLPASCSIGTGVAGEATIFIAGRFGLLPGGPFVIGAAVGVGTKYAALTNSNNGKFDQGNPTAPSLTIDYTTSSVDEAVPLANPILWPDKQPCVLALRFARTAGVLGKGQTDFWLGTTYRETLPFGYGPGTTTTGGFLGSLTGAAGGGLDCEISEFLTFGLALTDANVMQIIQTMQDKICGGFSNQAAVLFFGDSRTRGNNPEVNGGVGAPNAFDAADRSWPKRCLNQLGGYALGYNMARVGDTVANQTTQLTATYTQSSGNPQPQYASILSTLAGKGTATLAFSPTNVVAIGEVGINDVYFNGAMASSLQSSLTALWNNLLSSGAKTVIAMTIVPPAVGLVFAGTTFTQTMSNTIGSVNAWMKNTANLPAGVICCDNAGDSRWSNSGYVGSDGLHPADPGYGVYAQNAVTALKTALGLNAAPTSVALTFGNFPAGGRSLTYGSFR